MKIAPLLALSILLILPGLCRGQASGNVAYSQGGGAKARAEQNERNRHTLTPLEMPPTKTSMFIEANVLMNVKADEYVAVFGVAREGETVDECGRKMDAVVKEFTDAVLKLGVAPADVDVDFVAQIKIYGFEVNGDIAREKLTGFELKKNVAIRYAEKTLLDRLVTTAAKSQIYDLIKVDYHVKDVPRIHDRLEKEAARLLNHKKARYEELLGSKLRPAQVFADRTAVHYPTQLYDVYTAQESGSFNGNDYRQRYTVQSARKGSTFFFNGLDADGFDDVINPVVIEPVVQFTLFLKVKYEIEPEKAK